MKQFILLIGINAKYIHTNPAIYSLKAYADKAYPHRPYGGTVSTAEYTVNQPADFILADIYKRTPDVIAFSCYIWNWDMIRKLLAELPKILPDTELWLGGPEVSYDADRLVHEFPQLSGIMVGEGEQTFVDLLHYYWENQNAPDNINGIVCREGAYRARPCVDINALPFLYDCNDSLPDKTQNKIVYYESQRGCPFCCSYCLSSIDKTVRLRDWALVKEELLYFIEQKQSQVKFIDRTFNCNKTHSAAIWNYIKENDNGVTNFHFEIAADLLDDSQLTIMRDMRPGLIQLEIGVQSTNRDTLRAIRRNTNLVRLRENVSKIRAFGNIHMHLDLIAGLPYETYDSFAKSFDDVYAMAPDQLQLGFLKVLKGSPIWHQTAEYGIVYKSCPPYEVLYTKWLDYPEILKLKQIEEMVELYYNSGQFTYTLPVLTRAFASPFRMFEALAGFYQSNGYFVNVPARTYRYQVLLDFACTTTPDKRQMYQELLTFDLYIRENLKSRPVFSSESKVDKDKLRRFFTDKAQKLFSHTVIYTPAQLMRMTHTECFFFPVWQPDFPENQAALPAPAYILFDYECRNALTHNAAFYEIIL